MISAADAVPSPALSLSSIAIFHAKFPILCHSYRHSLLHDLLAGAFHVLHGLLGVDLLEDFQDLIGHLLKIDVLIIEDVDLIDVVLLHFPQFIVLLQLLLAVLLEDGDPTQVLLFYLLQLGLLLVVGLYDAFHLVLLVVQVLDLPDVVFLSVVEDLQQVVGLVLDGQVLSLFRLKGVFSEEHGIVVGLSHVRFPVSLWVVEGIDEIFESLQVIEDFSVLGDQVINLLCFGLDAVEFRH
jgi:hypothetical protein